jgi:two-component system OmpR family response regulator
MANRGLILVVDDDEDCRIIYPSAFRHAGFEVAVAATAAQGLALARETHPDAVVLDRLLPDRSGDQLLEELRSVEHMDDTPIVAVSAYTERGDVDRLRALGYSDVLPKPLEVKHLVASVERLLAGTAGETTRGQQATSGNPPSA